MYLHLLGQSQHEVLLTDVEPQGGLEAIPIVVSKEQVHGGEPGTGGHHPWQGEGGEHLHPQSHVQVREYGAEGDKVRRGPGEEGGDGGEGELLILAGRSGMGWVICQKHHVTFHMSTITYPLGCTPISLKGLDLHEAGRKIPLVP